MLNASRGERNGGWVGEAIILIFTFPDSGSSLPHMSSFWFSANYYYVFFGYDRRGPESRVR